MSLFTISRPIPLDAPVTIATLGLPESASRTRPPDEVDSNVMIVFSLCIAAYRRYKQTFEAVLAREVRIVADPYRTLIFAFTLLCDETLRPPVGQRSPQPLKGTKGKESQPNQAGNNVDGPHTSHDINILVVLEFAVKLPWLASRASFRLHLHESRKWP